MRRALLALALVLSGCAGADLAGGGVPALGLYGGAVTVQGPDGYCVDRAASRGAQGFAILAPCTQFGTEGTAFTSGVITVQVGAAGSAAVTGSEGELAQMLRAQPAMLSARGQGADIDVRGIDTAPGLVRVEFTDAGPPPSAAVGTGEWRAFLDIGGRLTTVALRAPAGAPLTAEAGQRLLDRAVATLRAANGSGATSTEA